MELRRVVFAMLLAAAGCAARKPDAEALAAGIKAKMKVPADVDAETRLDDVRANSKMELGYFLTLTKTTRAALAPDLGKLLETNLRGGACQNANYTTILKAGIAISVAYRTQDGADVARVVVAPKDCGL